MAQLTQDDVKKLQAEHPSLPADYLTYLAESGWGDVRDGSYMIYSGPVSPEDVYGRSVGPQGLVLLGDDSQGYCLGYSPTGKLDFLVEEAEQ